MTALAISSAGAPRAKKLQVAPSTRQKTAANAVPKLRYIVVLLAGIFAILGGQLLLSIAVSGGAYEIASLKSDLRGSHQQQQIVGEEISALVAPDTLATLAGSMGMVPDNNPRISEYPMARSSARHSLPKPPLEGRSMQPPRAQRPSHHRRLSRTFSPRFPTRQRSKLTRRMCWRRKPSKMPRSRRQRRRLLVLQPRMLPRRALVDLSLPR